MFKCNIKYSLILEATPFEVEGPAPQFTDVVVVLQGGVGADFGGDADIGTPGSANCFI